MITKTFEDWLHAFQLRNISKMVSLLTDDAKIESLAFGRHVGKDEASKYWKQLFKTFPDIKITPVTITSNDNRLAAEIDITGIVRHKAEVSLATGESIRGAFVYEFVDDKIIEIRMYYDSTVLKRHRLEMSNKTGRQKLGQQKVRPLSC